MRAVAGLVAEHVDADQQLELVEGHLHTRSVRSRERRVAGADEQGPDLTLAGCEDLVGEDRRGVGVEDHLEPADAGPSSVHAQPGRLHHLREVEPRRAHHGTARSVEIARHRVDDVEEPVGECPVRAHVQPGRRVEHRTIGRGVGGDQLAQHVGRHAGDLGAALRRPAGHHRGKGTESGGVPADQVVVDVIVGEELVEERGEEKHVGARANEDLLAHGPGRLGSSRVDVDDPAAPLDDRLQPLGGLGGLHDAHLADLRVGADQHGELGPVQVGDGLQERDPVHALRHQVLVGQVLRRGREDVGGAQPEHEPVEGRGVEGAEGGRVAEVAGHGVVTVAGPDVVHLRGDLPERLVPGDLGPLVTDPFHRVVEAVGGVVELSEPDPLHAGEALRADVILVRVDAQDPVLVGGDGEAAPGLADPAEGLVGRGRHGKR